MFHHSIYQPISCLSLHRTGPTGVTGRGSEGFWSHLTPAGQDSSVDDLAVVITGGTILIRIF